MLGVDDRLVTPATMKWVKVGATIIIDIGVNATRKVCGIAFSIEKFTKALKDLQTNGYIDKLIDETKKSNTCWHIEIKPNAKPLTN